MTKAEADKIQSEHKPFLTVIGVAGEAGFSAVLLEWDDKIGGYGSKERGVTQLNKLDAIADAKVWAVEDANNIIPVII